MDEGQSAWLDGELAACNLADERLVAITGEVIVAWTDYLGKRVALPGVPWRELPRGLRVSRAVATAFWGIAMVAMLIVGQIETSAIWQPATPDRVYVYPHEIKGSIRYFSDGQEQIYRIAKPLMLGAFVVLWCLAIPQVYLEGRLVERRKRDALEGAWQRLDERNQLDTTEKSPQRPLR